MIEKLQLKLNDDYVKIPEDSSLVSYIETQKPISTIAMYGPSDSIFTLCIDKEIRKYKSHFSQPIAIAKGERQSIAYQVNGTTGIIFIEVPDERPKELRQETRAALSVQEYHQLLAGVERHPSELLMQLTDQYLSLEYAHRRNHGMERDPNLIAALSTLNKTSYPQKIMQDKDLHNKYRWLMQNS
jgi:hypothetical protein